MEQAIERSSDDNCREDFGWLFIAGCIFLYPALFFTCVFIPIWMGWAP